MSPEEDSDQKDRTCISPMLNISRMFTFGILVVLAVALDMRLQFFQGSPGFKNRACAQCYENGFHEQTAFNLYTL